MKRYGALLLMSALGGPGCGLFQDDASLLVCRNDSECEDNEVCFPNGCGDPGENIVVEVAANPKAGLHAQDLAIDRLRAQLNLELSGPTSVQGTVRQQAAGSAESLSYAGTVVVRAVGESLLIPGVSRRFESRFTVQEPGFYTLPVGMGRMQVTLVPTDPLLPPVSETRNVAAGNTVALDFLLPASQRLFQVQGKVLQLENQLLDAELEVEALDAELKPLSQRTSVTRETGDFSLSLPPSAASLAKLFVRVTPKNAAALVPVKIFEVSTTLSAPHQLLLGAYGTPVKVGGRLLDSAGLPLPRATVFVEGPVGGGGTFQSLPVTTDAQGRFELQTLPNADAQSLTLSAVPEAPSRAGLTQLSLQVALADKELGDLRCNDKLRVRGHLLMPNGSEAAAGVRVVAEPIAPVDSGARAVTGAETTTDGEGAFELGLDPAEYRLDFFPSENLPRVSRFVTVNAAATLIAAPGGGLDLAAFTLSRGRQISGVVRSPSQGMPLSVGPYASIRFFRVLRVEGQPASSVLLSQTSSDSSGNYSAVLPTR